MIMRVDRVTLTTLVNGRRVCDATGEPLDPRCAVALTVTVRPGVSRLFVVTAEHWDSGLGPLTSGDPNVHPKVLDGRTLVAREGTRAWASESSPSRCRARETRPVPQPRPQIPGNTGVVPGVR
jgi:hypothetical protein